MGMGRAYNNTQGVKLELVLSVCPPWACGMDVCLLSAELEA